MTPERQSDDPSGMRILGAGSEFVGICAAMSLLGYWLDTKFDTAPWLLVGCAVVGFASATWVLLRALTEADRSSS